MIGTAAASLALVCLGGYLVVFPRRIAGAYERYDFGSRRTWGDSGVSRSYVWTTRALGVTVVLLGLFLAVAALGVASLESWESVGR